MRGVIRNDGTPHAERVRLGVQWLYKMGGGTVYVPLMRDFETYFGEPRTKGERRLASMGIRVEKMGRYMSPHGNVLALYPDARQIAELDADDVDNLLVVEWSAQWLDEWLSSNDVEVFVAGGTS